MPVTPYQCYIKKLYGKNYNGFYEKMRNELVFVYNKTEQRLPLLTLLDVPI